MTRRLTLVAGAGNLVPHLASAILQKSEPLQILDIAGRGEVPGAGTIPISLADADALIAAIKSFGTTHLLLAGAVHLSDAERQGLARSLGLAGRIAGGFGDIGLAGMILLYSKMHGIRLVGAHDVAPELVAPAGHIAGPVVAAGPDAPAALRAARAIGALDLGQSIVLSGSRAIAAEDAGGTDALLARVRDLRQAGLVGNASQRLILGKARKPRQPSFVDLPAIGPDTVVNAASAGISLIVVEAKAVLLLDRAGLESAATDHGVGVIGLKHG